MLYPWQPTLCSGWTSTHCVWKQQREFIFILIIFNRSLTLAYFTNHCCCSVTHEVDQHPPGSLFLKYVYDPSFCHPEFVDLLLNSGLFTTSIACLSMKDSSVALPEVSSMFSLLKGLLLEVFLVRTEGLWIEGVVCCTYCKARWGKFAVCDIGLHK